MTWCISMSSVSSEHEKHEDNGIPYDSFEQKPAAERQFNTHNMANAVSNGNTPTRKRGDFEANTHLSDAQATQPVTPARYSSPPLQEALLSSFMRPAHLSPSICITTTTTKE